MQRNDPYEKFAYDYDEFGPIDAYLGDERTFFERLFAKHGVKTVLDCACGTGQHLLLFSEMGLDVRGSDYSEAMLEVARRNLDKYETSVPLCQCDFRFLEQEHSETFDAVVCLTTALPHLHTDADLVTALASMKGRLNPGGLLVLTQGTTHVSLAGPAIEVIVNRTDFSRVFVKERDGDFLTIHVLDLFHSLGRTESNQYDIIYRILLDEDYKSLLAKAGFEKIQILGDYDDSVYTQQSRRLIVVAS
ncbi:MAG: class I SAM-dependent methyltransferase [Clostridiales bacterium]|nr:class I SAM-dependent methyltransferase [Clostridiales bacterium]